MAAIVQDDAAFFQKTNVVFIAVLVEGHQHIRVIAGSEHLAGADAHLENRWPARDGGGDGHKCHHLLLAAARQLGEKTANGLDAVLRVTGNADDGLGYFRDLWTLTNDLLGRGTVAH